MVGFGKHLIYVFCGSVKCVNSDGEATSVHLAKLVELGDLMGSDPRIRRGFLLDKMGWQKEMSFLINK